MSAVLLPNTLAARSRIERRLCKRRLKQLCRPSLQRSSLAVSRIPVGPKTVRRVTAPKRTRGTQVSSVLAFVSYVSPSRDFFEAAIHSLVGGSAMLCFALAFVPLLTYKEESEAFQEQDDLTAVKWSVAGVVSCFPYLNWTSWLLIAFDSDVPLPYGFLSVLYLIPFLTDGFDLNPFSTFMLVLGIMHMQVERVAQTEPAILGSIVEEHPELPSFVSQVSQSLTEQLPSVISNTVKRLGNDRELPSVSEMVHKQLTEKEGELKDTEELSRIEKQFWDDKFEDSSKK